MNYILKSAASLSFCACLFLTGCEQSRSTSERTISSNDSTVVISKNAAERELKELRDWVKIKSAKADSNARENWPEIKEGFKTRSAKLETRLDSLSDDSKREYAELKRKYENWETEKTNRTAQPLSETRLAFWRKELLGERANLNAVTASNARETYLLFMGIVRAKNKNWTPEDWDYADHVYGELNARKRVINNGISAADRLKINSLQAEYLALEAKHDAQDAYKYMKQDKKQ